MWGEVKPKMVVSRVDGNRGALELLASCWRREKKKFGALTQLANGVAGAARRGPLSGLRGNGSNADGLTSMLGRLGLHFRQPLVYT